jgi:hypothetical protein
VVFYILGASSDEKEVQVIFDRISIGRCCSNRGFLNPFLVLRKMKTLLLRIEKEVTLS